jgi:hypothetical protein
VTVRKQLRGGRSATGEDGLQERGTVSWGGAVKSGVVLAFYRGRGGEHRGGEFRNGRWQGLKGGRK